MMENEYVYIYEQDLESVQKNWSGELSIRDNYPIKHLQQIIDPDDVKYIIVVYSEGYMIVVTKHTYMERYNNKMQKFNVK